MLSNFAAGFRISHLALFPKREFMYEFVLIYLCMFIPSYSIEKAYFRFFDLFFLGKILLYSGLMKFYPLLPEFSGRIFDGHVCVFNLVIEKRAFFVVHICLFFLWFFFLLQLLISNGSSFIFVYKISIKFLYFNFNFFSFGREEIYSLFLYFILFFMWGFS